jgi:hypothetical protein
MITLGKTTEEPKKNPKNDLHPHHKKEQTKRSNKMRGRKKNT